MLLENALLSLSMEVPLPWKNCYDIQKLISIWLFVVCVCTRVCLCVCVFKYTCSTYSAVCKLK